ncbi:MAG: histidine phosphatase family protein [Phycisphaerales bacterium]|nr:histidine phosphatase family protein [Phycisphaerales bacterium]
MKIWTALGVLALAIIAALAIAQPTSTSPEPASPDAITGTHVVFIVRHADTDPKVSKNPPLTAQGQARAEHLAEVLQDEELGAIFVTNTARSMQTAAPAAAGAGITPTIYLPMDAGGLADTINGLGTTNATLVVAHSNTAPMIIAALGGPTLPDLEHDAFDHFYAVVLSRGRHVRTVKLRF